MHICCNSESPNNKNGILINRCTQPMKIITTFLLTLALSLFVQAKVFEEEYTFSYLRRNKGWIFLDRMKLGKGNAQVRFNTKLNIKDTEPSKTYMLELAVIPESLWAAESLMKCSKKSETLVGAPDSVQTLSSEESILTTKMSPENSFDSGLLNTFDVAETETYHFVLRDCEKNLLNEYFSRESRLEIQMEIKNNGLDYGEDEEANFYWFPLLIVLTVCMIRFIDVRKDESGNTVDSKDTDYVKILVAICLWLNLASLIFKYVGYLIYIYFGLSYSFFDFMYLLFHSVGDSVIVAIFLFVSFGWTITFISGKDFDLYVPLVSMMGLISVILTLLNKITDGTHDKYHMYDTIPAYLLVFFKAVTIVIFIVGCVKTYLEEKSSPKVQSFMLQILTLGGFYLFSIPLVMVLVEYFPASDRKEWVFILIELAKNFITFLLTYMISYSKSGYRSISFSNQSFMQMNGKVL